MINTGVFGAGGTTQPFFGGGSPKAPPPSNTGAKWEQNWLAVRDGYVGALGLPNVAAWSKDDTCYTTAKKLDANLSDYTALRSIFVKQCIDPGTAPADLSPSLPYKAMVISGVTLGAFIQGVTDNLFASLGAVVFTGAASGWYLRLEAQKKETLKKQNAVVAAVNKGVHYLIELIEWVTDKLLSLVDLDLATLQWVVALLLCTVSGFSVFAFGRYLKYAWIGIGPKRATPLLLQ